FKQIMRAFGSQPVDLILRGTQAAEKTQILADVIVFPTPLKAGDDHIHICFCGVVKPHETFGCRPCHENKNDDGNCSPDNFKSGAFMKVRRFYASGFAVKNHTEQHDCKDHNTDTYAPPEHLHMETLDILADRCHTYRHIVFPPLYLFCQGLVTTDQHGRGKQPRTESMCFFQHRPSSPCS